MQRTGTLLILLAATGYAFLPILVKWAYEADLRALDVVTWRFIFATPAIWLFYAFNRPPATTVSPRLPRKRLLGMGVVFAGCALLAFLALERIPASTYIVLAYAYPAFVALLSLLIGERLPLQNWFALVLTLIGIVLTVPDLANGFETIDPLGILFGVTNGAAYAVYLVISNKLLRGQTAFAEASALSISGSLLAFITIALFNGLQLPSTSGAWFSVIGIGIFSTVIPIFSFYSGMQKLGASQSAILSTIEAVIVLSLSFVLLGERMQLIQLIGGALIIVSAIMVQIRRFPIKGVSRLQKTTG